MRQLTKTDYQIFLTGKLFDLLTLIVKAAAFTVWLYILIKGISDVITKTPEQINAFTVLIRELISVLKKQNFYALMGWGCAIVTGISWKYERNKNKKLLKQLKQKSLNNSSETEDTLEE